MRHNVVAMNDEDIMVVTYPRGTTAAQVHRALTDHAEYGRWELARVIRYEGGARRAWLRRKVIRVQRSL